MTVQTQVTPAENAPNLPGYIDERAAAKKLGRSVRTLRQWRQRRCGPPFVKAGSLILYPEAGFPIWLKALEQPTLRNGKAA